VQGVNPKSFQVLSDLGRLMYLDADNQLNQYDITSNKSLPQVSLGTRPPLKHYDIIDVVCDQTSGRIYTLNSNWILEIWNLEQNSSLPQKRLAVCTNEGNKDFISLYYKQTFNNSKPRFLSLAEHNQQILVVNTSCVDGSVVFIDPISFSVLKKMQLRYQDYEVPKAIRESIFALRKVLGNLVHNKRKSAVDIFKDIIDPQLNGEIRIRSFVNKLVELDNSLKADDLYRICSVLDADNNGCISLEEFIQICDPEGDDQLTQTDFERKKQEEEMFDKMWPEWVVSQGKVPEAKEVLSKMYEHCVSQKGIEPETLFGLYDYKDTGMTTVDHFTRIIDKMFSQILSQEQKDLVLRLAAPTINKEVNFRDFCKFLNKRFIRTFKKMDPVDQGSDQQVKELDYLLRKEASLNYALRKAAELNLDLRTIFLKNDPNNLSVIPRAKFYRILDELPLGLLKKELDEIFDSDLSFDNYGNVDYTVILNSDIFVALERQRLRRF